MDFEVGKSTRVCAVSGREIRAGETFHSVLLRDGADVKRLDYAHDAWTGAPPEALAVWTSVMPQREGSHKPKLAPSEVLLRLFGELGGDPSQHDLRYVLTLMLIRRRLLRLEETKSADGSETMVLFCPRDEQTYEVAVTTPAEPRVQEIQDYLTSLLFAPAG